MTQNRRLIDLIQMTHADAQRQHGWSGFTMCYLLSLLLPDIVVIRHLSSSDRTLASVRDSCLSRVGVVVF